MKKRILSLLLAALLALSVAGCERETQFVDVPVPSQEASRDEPLSGSDDDFFAQLGADTSLTDRSAHSSWAIYWYLCGSDLESRVGFATIDLLEMLAVNLPGNVRVVIQTGGASRWHNDAVESGKLQRWVCDSEGLWLVEELPDANMGEASTVEDFLSFCEESYPADHKGVIFWDHGGGCFSGVSFDERHGYDCVTLPELTAIFDSVYGLDPGNPPVDFIGFDACLMATIDTAAALRGAARYMVASEELEPGIGWNYTGLLEALAEDDSLDPGILTSLICETYLAGCDDYGVGDTATLSVTDLTGLDPLLAAYDQMGREALTAALDDSSFLAAFGRAAQEAEKYGGNSPDEGYTNLVDLGDLLDYCEDLLPASYEAVTAALEACVTCRVAGPYRSCATGLSCYFPYDGDAERMPGYLEVNPSESVRRLYTYTLTGELDAGYFEEDYIEEDYFEEDYFEEDIPEDTPENIPEVPTLLNSGHDSYPVTFNEDDDITLDTGEEDLDYIAGVWYALYRVDLDSDEMVLLGRNDRLRLDWESKTFVVSPDFYDGVWAALDGHPVFLWQLGQEDGYHFYSIPILLNGELTFLRAVFCDFDLTYELLGIWDGLDDQGMADKNLAALQPGDEVTTLFYTGTVSDVDQMEFTQAETFTVTEDTALASRKLEDGSYTLKFEIQDIQGNLTFSDPLVFQMLDGSVTLVIDD